MKSIVLYKSKYGNTLKYATMLSKELDWELRDFSDFKKNEIDVYDKVIFATGVYIGRMNQVKKAMRWFKNKKIIICACAGNNFIEKEIDKIKHKNFQNNELSFHKFFYLPGGVDFSKVKGFKGKMLKFFRKQLENKKNKTHDEIEMLKGFTNPTDLVDKKHIKPIIEYINQPKD